MKKIEAIVQPQTIENVRDALLEAGVVGMTILEVGGIGRQKGHPELYRGSEYQSAIRPKMKIELVVPDEIVDTAVSTIVRAARTGQIGDGKIFISQVDEAVRIRTEESGDTVL